MRALCRLLLVGALATSASVALSPSGSAHAREGEPGARHTAASQALKTPSRADRQRERAREIQAHRKRVDTERQRHLTRVSQLRQERRRPEKAKDRGWRTNIDQQLFAENHRYRQWLKDHRLKR